MKTLKKVLSLVLVVAMIASMLIVGAAAAEETQYPEAAAVITGIKVMEGDERGMRYGDGVTREEAAAIICRVLLGETAETLATTSAPFADVAATRWSAGYIAYLKGQGIVSGVTDTEFAPSAPVTGIQFAKMLLTAVGYGKAGEFDGAAWDINTITYANDTGIFDGTNDLILTDGATREECMLYAYNALLVPTVKYNKTFESYYTGVSALQPVTEEAELLEYTLAALKFNLESTPTVDFYGRPAADYVIGNDVLAERVLAATPDFELTNIVDGATLYAKLGATAKKVDKIVAYVDGGAPATWAADEDEAAAILSPYNSVVYWAGYALTNQGAHVEAYVSVEDDITTLTLVVWYEYISTVADVATTGVVTLASTSKGIIPGAALYAHVVYTASPAAAPFNYGCDITSAEIAAPTYGVFEKIDALGNYVFGGVAYPVSDVHDALPVATETGKLHAIYTDSLGNILKAVNAETAVVSNDYLYVLDAVITPATGGIEGTAQVAKLEVVYADGGYAIVEYTTGVNALGQPTVLLPDTTVPTLISTSPAIADGWYSYITAEDGSVTLVNAAYATTGLEITKGKYTVGGFDGFQATSGTVLNVVNQYGVVETYTGIANFETTDEDTYAVMIEVIPYTNIITTINVYGAAASIRPVALPTIGYAAQYLYQDTYGYHYNFAINGAMVEVIDDEAGLAYSAYEVVLTPYGYVVNAETAADAKVTTSDSVYNTTYAKYENVIVNVDAQYFTVVNAAGDAYNSYYYNASVFEPTFVIDLANNGALGTLTAGRRATVACYDSTNNAAYIFLH